VSTEVEVYEDAPVEGEIVEAAPLTKRAAQALDKKIRAASDKLSVNVNTFYDLLEQAAQGSIHVALEYPSWTAWMADAVQFTPSDRVERKELVKLMNGKGMSQRAIAGTLNISQKTVDRDLDGVESDDSTVTTVSGRTYPKNKTAPEPVEEEEDALDVEEVPLLTVNEVAAEFRDEVDAVGVSIQAFKDILDYEEYDKASKTVASRYLNKMGEYISELQKIVDRMMV